VPPSPSNSPVIQPFLMSLLRPLLDWCMDLFHEPACRARQRWAMGFVKSKAKMLTEKHGRVTFDDVAHRTKQKNELGKRSLIPAHPQNSSVWPARSPKVLA